MRMKSAILVSLSLAVSGCAHMPRIAADPICRPSGMDSTDLPTGRLLVNIGAGKAGKVDYEVVVWAPKSPQADAVHMIMRWEAHAPASLDFERGSVQFNSDRLWRNPSVRKLPRKLTLELRANRVGPWEEGAALRGAIRLQYGVRLAADWADVKAMASNRAEIYLITKSDVVVVDTVTLKRSDFELPLGDIDAFRAKVLARATGPDVTCDPSEDIIIT